MPSPQSSANIDLANSALDARDQNESRLRLRDAMNASERARNLSQQLLTFAKGGSPEMKPLSLPELIKGTVSFSLQGSNIAPEINLADGLWPVEGDRGQLSQVLSNLLINARQAMPEGGTIKISAHNIKRGIKGGSLEAKFVVIQIEDNGPGILKENLEHIFDPFFTTKETGHGLGLSVANSILKKHGGSIEVQSIEGAGTFFYVYLPASDTPPENKETPVHAVQKRHTGRILVMDDEESIRKLVLHGVQKAGYAVSAAADGAEVIELYRNNLGSGQAFDAMILDLTVPGGMGGRETIAELLKLDPGVSAIASSGYSDDAVMANFREFGFKGTLGKPYTISALLSVLEKVSRERTG